MKKTNFEKLNQQELKNISSSIKGAYGGGSPGGIGGPCGVEPNPSDMTPKEYAIAIAQWISCMEMYNNPENKGTCIF